MMTMMTAAIVMIVKVTKRKAAAAALAKAVTKVSLGFVCATKFCAGRKKSKRGQRNMTSLTGIHFVIFSTLSLPKG